MRGRCGQALLCGSHKQTPMGDNLKRPVRSLSSPCCHGIPALVSLYSASASPSVRCRRFQSATSLYASAHVGGMQHSKDCTDAGLAQQAPTHRPNHINQAARPSSSLSPPWPDAKVQKTSGLGSLAR